MPYNIESKDPFFLSQIFHILPIFGKLGGSYFLPTKNPSRPTQQQHSFRPGPLDVFQARWQKYAKMRLQDWCASRFNYTQKTKLPRVTWRWYTFIHFSYRGQWEMSFVLYSQLNMKGTSLFLLVPSLSVQTPINLLVSAYQPSWLDNLWSSQHLTTLQQMIG